jgi:putative SOS response-associated peptidase YedK
MRTMCGRMTQQTSPAEVARIFDAESRVEEAAESAGVRFNVAPTEPLTVVLQRGEEGRVVEQHRWGLIPSWAKSAREGARMMNARAETVMTSPAFRSSFRTRRCIVPSDGFYEWRRPPTAEGSRRSKGRSQPFFLHPPEGAVLAMAGLWSVWKDPGSGTWVPSVAVITTRANQAVADIHDRMPVLLPREAWADWLDVSVGDADYLRSLLEPAPDDVLGIYPISTRVNDVRNEGPELIAPLDTEGKGEVAAGTPGIWD